MGELIRFTVQWPTFALSLHPRQMLNVHQINDIPYSAKFLRDKFSPIGLLQIFMEINFGDEGFLLTMPTLGSHMHCLCWFVLTMPPSAAPFQIQVFLLRDELHLEPSRFCLLELTNYASQARDACPLTNAMNVEGAYKGGPQKSGSIHFETMIECHVALDVHAIPIV